MSEALRSHETETRHATPVTRATPRACAHCRETFTPKRADARFCSPACRLSAHRAAKAQGSAPAPSVAPKRRRPGGHKPDGKARYAELKRQAEEADRLWQQEQARKPKDPKPPVPYSDEIAAIILERLEQGESLKSICSSPDLPSEAAVRKWTTDEERERTRDFGVRYVRARERGWLVLADQLEDFASGEELGERRFEPGVVQRHRLQVDTRRWLLSKCLPKIFGDRVDVTSAGQPLQQVGTLDLAKAVLAALQAPALPAPDVIDVTPVEPSSTEEGS